MYRKGWREEGFLKAHQLSWQRQNELPISERKTWPCCAGMSTGSQTIVKYQRRRSFNMGWDEFQQGTNNSEDQQLCFLNLMKSLELSDVCQRVTRPGLSKRSVLKVKKLLVESVWAGAPSQNVNWILVSPGYFPSDLCLGPARSRASGRASMAKSSRNKSSRDDIVW